MRDDEFGLRRLDVLVELAIGAAAASALQAAADPHHQRRLPELLLLLVLVPLGLRRFCGVREVRIGRSRKVWRHAWGIYGALCNVHQRRPCACIRILRAKY